MSEKSKLKTNQTATELQKKNENEHMTVYDSE